MSEDERFDLRSDLSKLHEKIPQEQLVVYYTVKCSECGNTDPEMIFSFLKREKNKDGCASYGCKEDAIKDRPYCADCAIVGDEE